MTTNDLHDEDLDLIAEPVDAGSDAESEELWTRLEAVSSTQNPTKGPENV